MCRDSVIASFLNLCVLCHQVCFRADFIDQLSSFFPGRRPDFPSGRVLILVCDGKAMVFGMEIVTLFDPKRLQSWNTGRLEISQGLRDVSGHLKSDARFFSDHGI